MLESMMHLSRRELLRSAPLLAASGGLLLSRAALAGQSGAESRFPGMIVRMERPRNLETPLTALQQQVVPNEQFFVRSHFAVPTIDAKSFRLTVEGHVEKKLELTLDDLKKMDAVSREIVVECAGNGRVFLAPQARGLQWGHGGVGNAKWTGVPLGAVLERAGVKRGAAEVVLIGGDEGTIADPATPGPIHFDRGIPLAKATRDETLLAWEMNGETLPASHGYPLRAIVGGWYGMAAAKWLTRIVVTDRPHNGFWQTFDYSIWDRAAGPSPQLIPVTAIEPKAVITDPAPGGVVKAGTAYTVAGMAWAGENAVAKVEISTDGGKNWAAATVPANEPLSWAAWSWKWTVPNARGTATILARCTDTKGNTQPEKRDHDRRTYMINHLIPVELTIK
jgi:DMSO/TMAO reductase YedYZ molybdopterin-dependent catalytic subunit